eukprot:g41831.t1
MKFPEALFIVAGNFNQANLKRVLAKHHQHISCPTKGPNILDHCYTTIKDAYRSIPCPHFEKSDHNAVSLLPAYKQKLKREDPSQKVVQCWSDAAEELLRDCLESVDWTIFKNSVDNLNKYTTTIMDFINNAWKTASDAISLAVHSFLEQLDNKDTYTKLLLIDYSSAFNRLNSKLQDLGVGSALCNWIISFLTHRPQSVTIDPSHFSTTMPNAGTPQGYVLSPLLYSLYTHDCVAKFQMNATCTFAEDITVHRKFGISIRTLTNFYRCTIESIMAWYCNYSAQDHKKLLK